MGQANRSKDGALTDGPARLLCAKRFTVGTVFLASLLALAGCAASVVSGNAHTVVIGKVSPLSVEEAQPLADKHCAQYGKKAQLQYSGTRDIYFDCVEGKAR